MRAPHAVSRPIQNKLLLLRTPQELVCLEQRADLLAVGSMRHVSLLDPRRWAAATSSALSGLLCSLSQACLAAGVAGVSQTSICCVGRAKQRVLRRLLLRAGDGRAAGAARSRHTCRTHHGMPYRAALPCRTALRRRAPEVTEVASPDDNHGVRSVQMTDHLLSFGTGRGKLFFWDLRAGAFLPTGACPCWPLGRQRRALAGCWAGSAAPWPMRWRCAGAACWMRCAGLLHASSPSCLSVPPPELSRFDYGSGGLYSKLAPQPAAAWAPRRHLQLGDGHVERNELYYEHFAGGLL